MGLPTRDGELLTYAEHFAAYVIANGTALGFTVPQTTQLNDVVVDYHDAFGLASNEVTRTSGTIVDKDLKRGILKATLRSYIARIQANPAVTAQQKADLSITIRDSEPTPQPPPNTRPVVTVVRIVNNDVVVRMVDELTPTRRARPRGCAGIAIYSFVGENVPADLEQWRHEGLATKAEFTIGFNAADAGKKITIVARYYSRKGEFGPMSAAITTVIAALPLAA
ncbi:MAG: hypothetical protein QOE14_606 [Humisphaera sp.]|nr:hypothetical protein [Humisphaera sp.]